MNNIDYQIIKTKGGAIQSCQEMEFRDQKFVFTGTDPQIHIIFPEPIQNIMISWKTGQASFLQSLATLYYQYDHEGYSETKTCKFCFPANSKKTKAIHFEKKIKAIRLDLVDFCGDCEVENFSIETIKKMTIERCLERNWYQNESIKTEDKVVVLTHELSASGAPILAFHIANELKKRGKEVVVLTRHQGDGFLKEQFCDAGISVVDLSNQNENEVEYFSVVENQTSAISDETYIHAIMCGLRKSKYDKVIANTVVSGLYVNILKDYNFKIISLIHEMKATIEMYDFVDMGKNIANYADYIVFPNHTVELDFRQIFPNLKGKCIVRPQGVYLQKVEIDKGKTCDLSEYGISDNDQIVMSSGTCELRKGIDIFVSAALLLQDMMRDESVHFVWTGNFADEELKGWLLNQIERAKLSKQFHFISFIKEAAMYNTLLTRASVFWALSREDPFPSTVLEAMKEKVPVVGFAGTGGIEVMLQDARGILLEFPQFYPHRPELNHVFINNFQKMPQI
ncbi:MAG: glycosyltransferase family 4 protein [Hespellia sp.]|nr:glycosyltransferase family 4 protein [Hespellia sp.]